MDAVAPYQTVSQEATTITKPHLHMPSLNRRCPLPPACPSSLPALTMHHMRHLWRKLGRARHGTVRDWGREGGLRDFLHFLYLRAPLHRVWLKGKEGMEEDFAERLPRNVEVVSLQLAPRLCASACCSCSCSCCACCYCCCASGSALRWRRQHARHHGVLVLCLQPCPSTSAPLVRRRLRRRSFLRAPLRTVLHGRSDRGRRKGPK